MARIPRTRTKSMAQSGSKQISATEYESGLGDKTFYTYRATSTCNDYIGRPITESPLTSDQQQLGCELNGDVWGLMNRIERFEGYPLAWTYEESSHNSTPLPEPSGWMLDLVAGTNPSRPMVTPPTMLQDLIDLPRMIHNAGLLLSNPKRYLRNDRDVANNYLASKFGWLPLVDDLHKLIDLQSYVLKRNKELQNLYAGKGLRRRLQFGSETRTSSCHCNIPLQGPIGSSVIVRGSYTTTKKSWATIRWKPSTLPPYHPDDHRWNDLSRRLLLGLSAEGIAKGLWDVIPWTWLLGWFTNLGKFTLAQSNTIPATHSKGCFMSQTEAVVRAGMVEYLPGVRGTLQASGQTTRTRKTRVVSSPLILPGLGMPFLDMSRLSVLGALTIQRFRR